MQMSAAWPSCTRTRRPTVLPMPHALTSAQVRLLYDPLAKRCHRQNVLSLALADAVDSAPKLASDYLPRYLVAT